MTDILTKTAVGRMIDAEFDERAAKIQRTARLAEDRGFYVALCIAALYATGEFVVYMGLVTPPADRGFPWMTAGLFVGCVIPKILGRTTGGKIWLILANAFASWFSRGRKGA